jgi:hypothetical protein
MWERLVLIFFNMFNSQAKSPGPKVFFVIDEFLLLCTYIGLSDYLLLFGETGFELSASCFQIWHSTT